MAEKKYNRKDELRFIPHSDMPNVMENAEYYELMRKQGRLRILIERPNKKEVIHEPTPEEVYTNVRNYLKPIDDLRDYTMNKECFNMVLDRLLRNPVINSYLGKSRCVEGKVPDFNRWNVFRFIGELRRRRVYTLGGVNASNRDYEKKLEKSARRFHSHMSQGVPAEVEREIVHIIKEYK